MLVQMGNVEESVNCRRCRLCTRVIEPARLATVLHAVSDDLQILAAALLAGFCSIDCMQAHAVDAVTDGSAWWCKGESK